MRVLLKIMGLLLGLMLISPLPLPVQADEPLRFEHLTVEDDLSNSAVMFIMQDSQGFMWFGTQDGLNQYDGCKVTVYRHVHDNPNSLSGHSQL